MVSKTPPGKMLKLENVLQGAHLLLKTFVESKLTEQADKSI